MSSLPVKPELGPTLPQLLRPWWRGASLPVRIAAAELVGAGTVIPCHYDTFPPIETDAEAFKADVERATSSSVLVLAPGESHSA